MTKIIISVAMAICVVGLIFSYLAKIKHDAAVAERAKVIAEQIAKSNQLIAERRALDATFDKMDAAAVCRDSGLSWVYEDNHSRCE
jgi:hypothetical protein